MTELAIKGHKAGDDTVPEINTKVKITLEKII